ncbi:DUF3316 domain-containing protein [Bacteroidales bacterium OttesenSCG-928-I14]|nr:DUF3316 domain-containing protein [Bacteroidales bacterium OttesenSCG-928-I14]
MKKQRCIYILLLSIISLILPSIKLEAQESRMIDYSYRSHMIGIGAVQSYDTYLSPLNYKGTGFNYMYETLRKRDDNKLMYQHLFNLDFASSSNPSGTANCLMGGIEYNFGLYHRLYKNEGLELAAGGQIDALFGVLYNSRNGNNPASPKIHLNLNMSAIASYSFKLFEHSFMLRYQINLPFAGLMYANDFGQSYYEMDLTGYTGLFHFSSFHNQLMMRNILSLDYCDNHHTFRIAYMNNSYGTHINDLETRVLSNTFLIGITKMFSLSK